MLRKVPRGRRIGRSDSFKKSRIPDFKKKEDASLDERRSEFQAKLDANSHKVTTAEARIMIQLPKSNGNLLRAVLLFLATTLVCAVALELWLLAGSRFFNYLRLETLLQFKKNCSLNTVVGPKFAIYGSSKTEDHLQHVLQVLERFGYQRTTIKDDWDLLWAHNYPFLQMPQMMKNLQSHQIANHLPGCGFITNKVELSTTALPFLPKAFKLPTQKNDFMYYAHMHPEALFVTKNNAHRNIEIRFIHEINLNASDTFVQEFIQNPFLVDGYKFDFGVYVLITSVDPLRIYIYAGDIIFRYCAVKYHPFDAKNVEKYVVGDDYLPTWEVPLLRKYYLKFSGSMRGAFDAYVRDQKLDPSVIWPQVEEIVRHTVLAKEKDIGSLLKSYKTPYNFFDLMRFDMIIDDKLRVYLMEANMSPNLSSARFKPNSLLYEQVLYSALNLLGIGSPVKKTKLKEGADDLEGMISSKKNLATNINICAHNECDKSCNLDICKLCLPCISGTEYYMLEKAYREHIHRADMKRIFPKPILNPENFDIEQEVQNLTEKNQWMTRWYHGKCMYDRTWCL